MAYLKVLIVCLALTAVFAEKSKPRQRCVQSTNCVDNAECIQEAKDKDLKCLYGSCKCKSGYRNDNEANPTKCESYNLKQKKDDTCNDAKDVCDATKGLICKGAAPNAKCDCRDNKFEWKDNKCTVKTLLGYDADCDHSEECAKTDDFPNNSGTCTGTPKKCKCIGSYSTVNNKCVKQDYNDNCKDGSNKCKFGPNLECKSDKCACLNNFKYDSKRKYCIKSDSVTNRKEKELCTFGDMRNDKQHLDCESKLTCRRCSYDVFGLSTDGVCVKTSDITGSGVSHYVSFSILLTGILAYFAF